MNSALDGLRVLDFTTTIAGPHCGRMLADLGAEVIKIEAPEGDMMRTRPPLRNGASTSFGQLNAGKKSIALDLKSPRGAEAARRLVATADVVVENFRPGVMRRFGLDYPAMKEIKPDLVYCAISGYGQTGPSAELPAYAPVIHASSGYDLAQIAHQEEARRPGLLRHLYRRRADRHLCLWRDHDRALPAPDDRRGPDDRRIDARKHAEPDLERNSGGAIRGGAARAADLRPDRHQGRLYHAGDRQRADVPEPRRRPAAIPAGSPIHGSRNIPTGAGIGAISSTSSSCGRRSARPPRSRRSSTAMACRPRPIVRSRKRWPTRSSPTATPSPRSPMPAARL